MCPHRLRQARLCRKTPIVGDTPLIPRKTFFENAKALNPRLSPDGQWLAWIAAFDGVMNIWAAPREGPLRTAQRLATRTAAELLPSELETLLELLVLSRRPDALCYMPLVWES